MKNPFNKKEQKTITEFAKEFFNIQTPPKLDKPDVNKQIADLQRKVESLESENAAFRAENEALKSAMSEIAKPDTNSIAKIRAAAQGFVTATAEGSTT